MKKKLPEVVYNPVSMFGGIVALTSFLLILAVVFFASFTPDASPYLGIMAFIIFPVILVVGLLLIPIGAKLERNRRAKTENGTTPQSFRLDLGNPQHRRAMGVTVTIIIIFIIATAMGTYQAYEFTESVTFCGEVCHTPMEPEYTAYQNSPHARVTCAECHVGRGATWYARSKLSGMYQVYAASFDLFPRPIPVPIENLRPARETCEQCHWPDKFHGSQERNFVHYLPDEENTEIHFRLLVKTGGGSEENGRAEGIHWHMNIANEIDYIATDKQRQEIAWVRTKDPQGNERIYVNEENPIEPEDVKKYEMRRMDCIDCHNRPTHVFLTPDRAVDNFLFNGRIDRSLPSIKRIAVESLIGELSTKDSALAAIGKRVRTAYAEEYPEVLEERSVDVDSAIAAVKEVYRRNFFPEMKVRWDVYPENIGHLSSPGCFRCHNGTFKSDDGKTISRDCRSCHIIISQGKTGAAEMINPGGLEFEHPEDIDGEWKETSCSECHTGTSQL